MITNSVYNAGCNQRHDNDSIAPLIEKIFGQKSLNHTLDLKDISEKKKLRIFKNTIFAQYGMKFTSSDLQKYFKKYKWYEPSSENVDHRLSALDKSNLKTIRYAEELLIVKSIIRPITPGHGQKLSETEIQLQGSGMKRRSLLPAGEVYLRFIPIKK